MFARLKTTTPIFIVGIAYLFTLGIINVVQGEIESLEQSPVTELGRSQLKILQVGEFFCDIAAEPNEIWLGLYPTKDGYSLMSSQIRVEAFYDPLIGDDENASGATRVSVHGKNAPLFLVTGMDSLRTGTVKTVFSGRLPLPLGSSLEFTLDNESAYAITAIGGAPSKPGAAGYKVKLDKGNRSQVICSVKAPNASVSYLLWAGDLDRDGKLDLLIDTVCDYSTSGAALFLSSLAEEDNLLRKAAQFDIAPSLN